MSLERNKARIRVMRDALTSFLRIARQNRNFGLIAKHLVKVAAREGVAGVKVRLLYLAGLRGPSSQLYSPPPAAPLAPTYEDWRARFDSLRPEDIAAAQRHLADLALPAVLIVAVLSREEIVSLERLAASWRQSIHAEWQAVIVPPRDTPAEDLQALQSTLHASTRISFLRAPEDLEALRARFDLTLICFGNVLLNPLSLYMFAEAAARTGAEVVYADNDHVDAVGRRGKPDFKPRFSPEYIAHYNYIGDCLFVSRAVALSPDDLAAFFGMDVTTYDRFVARLVAGRHVEHLPFILSHVAVRHAREGFDPVVHSDDGPGVAIIIPTRDGLDYLKPCIDSIREQTVYSRDLVDIIVIDNRSSDPAALTYLAELDRQPNVTVLKYPKPFNFAAINNLGAQHTRRDILVFLNNDTTVHDPRWLSKLVTYAQRPEVGVVGAKLLFPDGSIQHGGCAAGGNAGTVSHLLIGAMPGDVAASDHTREMSLVTGACCAIRRSVFAEVGGFDPILRVTWNDVKLCLSCLEAGYRNIYVADPLLVHHEQKTRGAEDTVDKVNRYFGEANYTRRRYGRYFQDDPSYNPNLPIQPETIYAEPPRVRRPWSGRGDKPWRILVLSSVYKFGFGVPVVIQQQVLKLQALGYEVVIGGPHRDNELQFPGCERVLFDTSRQAAAYAFETDVDLIICHTPPFFDIPLMIGGHIPVLAYDYGEPPADLFPDPVRSYLRNVDRQKRSSTALTTRIATISQAVKDETLNDDATVVGLANSHLPRWSDALRPQRDEIRRQLGWDDAFVVLTVCRFGVNERAYKGLDKVAAIARDFPFIHPAQAAGLVWALAGAGDEDDVRQVEELGISVFPNVPDSRLAELYMAADAYMSFSRWEGYNLGISQALAMGLPVAASDIPAHREFPIFTSDSTLAVCGWLAREIQARDATDVSRSATVYEWTRSVTAFSRVVDELLGSRGVREGA